MSRETAPGKAALALMAMAGLVLLMPDGRASLDDGIIRLMCRAERPG